MLKKDQLMFAIEDARARQSAVMLLLHEIDRKALGLLRISVTLVVAMVSVVAANLERDFLSFEFAFGLGTTTFVMLISAFFSIRVVMPAAIKLPGRDADFWCFYIDKDDQTFRHAAIEYLRSLKKSNEENRGVNEKMIGEYRKAKLAFTLAPAIGLATAVLVAALSYWM